MGLTDQEIFQFAHQLDEAVITRKEIRRLTATQSAMSLEEAYKIQDAGIRLRLARGEKIVGYKMGLTSKAKMQQMGVASPIAGVLTSSMQVVDGGALDLSSKIHPKIEPEIAFITKRDMEGELKREDFLRNCDAVVAALEIIDSRFLHFDFALADVLADNCSSSAFVLSSQQQYPTKLDLDALEMRMEINGRCVQSAVSSAIYGHPVDSCLELVRLLTRAGKCLPAYSIVLAGGATAAEALHPGDIVRLEVSSLGSVSLRAL